MNANVVPTSKNLVKEQASYLNCFNANIGELQRYTPTKIPKAVVGRRILTAIMFETFLAMPNQFELKQGGKINRAWYFRPVDGNIRATRFIDLIAWVDHVLLDCLDDPECYVAGIKDGSPETWYFNKEPTLKHLREAARLVRSNWQRDLPTDIYYSASDKT